MVDHITNEQRKHARKGEGEGEGEKKEARGRDEDDRIPFRATDQSGKEGNIEMETTSFRETREYNAHTRL